MKTVVLSQRIHEDAMAMLDGRVNILIPEEQGQEAFERILGDADAVILRTNVKMTASAIAKAPRLGAICRTGAGTDNVDKEECKKRGIVLTNTPTANSISVAEHAVSLALALSKRLPVYDRETRSGGWLIRTSNTSRELNDKTVGIIGLGHIGRNAAEMFRLGFNMKVIAYDPFVKPESVPEYELTDDVGYIFGNADVISLHCPSIPETRGMVNAALLSRAKPGLILINCSRGDVVVQADVADALSTGRLAAAGLDVFETEPIDPESPLIGMDNVILTPHSAALTKEASIRMATEAAEAALSFLNGEQPKHIVKL